MASNSKSESSKSDRLPFEPKKKAAKDRPSASEKTPRKESASVKSGTRKSRARGSAERTDRSIPEVVSKRMVRRIAFFCGFPTLMGIATFVLSYFIISREWFELPHVAVLLVSMGWFGLGVLGVTYGALSASWEEEEAGGLLGVKEFNTNLGRTLAAWREAKQRSNAGSS